MPYSTDRASPILIGSALALLALTGCTELQNVLDFLQSEPETIPPQIVMIRPSTNSTAQIGATVVVAWADYGGDAGTTVKLEAERLGTGDTVEETITLVEGRDALAHGEANIHDFDSNGRAAGRYRFRATMTASDGTTATSVSTGIVTLQ